MATKDPNNPTDLEQYMLNQPNRQQPAMPYQPVPGQLDPNNPYPSPPAAVPATPTAPQYPVAVSNPNKSSANMPAGIDPALARIYQTAGVTPADRGSGFFDWQYWQGVGSSQYDRLARDLAGTGTDQPTGTPGSGPWSNSGRGAPVPGGRKMLPGGNLAGDGRARSVDGWQNNGAIATRVDESGTGGFGGMGGGAGMGGNDLLNYLLGRGTGQLTDDNMPNLQVDPNSPIIRKQTDAFRANEDRNTRNALSRAAEKGGPLGNTDAVGRSLTERAGQATSQFEAQAMVSELNARRQEIQQALSLGTGYMTAQQQMALQRELAQLSAQVQMYMQSNDLAERGYEFDVNDQFRNSPLYGG